MSVKLKQIVATVKESILLNLRHFVELGEKLKDIRYVLGNIRYKGRDP